MTIMVNFYLLSFLYWARENESLFVAEIDVVNYSNLLLPDYFLSELFLEYELPRGLDSDSFDWNTWLLLWAWYLVAVVGSTCSSS